MFSPTSVAFDLTNGIADGTGVLQGLQYKLAAGAPTSVAGTAASTTSIGTADAKTYNITGTMPANQAGTCPTGVCFAKQTRTLTITY